MTTREWLEQDLMFSRTYSRFSPEAKERPVLIERLIAHLDLYGWPETPKTCETCRHKVEVVEGSPVFPFCPVWEDSVQSTYALVSRIHYCGAWQAKEPTP